jgi:hypothetical protein
VASAPGALPQTLDIPVVVAPVFFPAVASLSTDATTRISIISADNGLFCEATPARGVTVMSAGADLTAGGNPAKSNGLYFVDIAVAAGAQQTSTTLSCIDSLGQDSTATYTVTP